MDAATVIRDVTDAVADRVENAKSEWMSAIGECSKHLTGTPLSAVSGAIADVRFDTYRELQNVLAALRVAMAEIETMGAECLSRR